MRLSAASIRRDDLDCTGASQDLPASRGVRARASAALAFYGPVLGSLAAAYLAIGVGLRMCLWEAFRRGAGSIWGYAAERFSAA